MAARKPSKTRKKPASRNSAKKTTVSWRGRIWRGLFYVGLAAVLLFAGYWGWMDHKVRDRFAGAKWELAARIYARPLELYAGAPVSAQMLRLELKGLNYQPVEKVVRPGQFSWQGNRVEVYRRAHKLGAEMIPALPLALTFTSRDAQQIDSFTADDAIVALEPKEIGSIYPATGEDRVLTRLQEIPPLLGETLLAVEDRSFMDHHGISLRAISRAFMANLKAGAVVQGGSTLTQQLVKNMYLTNERSLIRKLNEALMTLSLEWHYSKSDILEAYLNEVFLGQSGNRAIHGFALASQFYFNKNVSALNTEEIALLVGLVKGASFYSPWRQPQRSKARRDTVLAVMRDSGLITDVELTHALAQPLTVVKSPASQHAYPAFVGLVKQQLLRDYPLELLQSDGLTIYTTLAPSVQTMAEESLSQTLGQLETQYKIPASQLQGAVVVTAVGSGEVRAVVGDRNPRYHGFNRALDTQRAIGSLIKPALYLTALESGNFTLATPLDDGPVEHELRNGDVWTPTNFSGIDHGLVPLYTALANSYNQAAARLGLEIGIDEVVDTVHRLGVEQAIAEVPAVVLGAVDLSPLVVSDYFHTLANEGIYSPLRAIREVYAADGARLRRYPLNAREAISSNASYLIDFAMQITARQGTARKLYTQLPESLSVAGKTGTTNDQRDSWFAGYTGSDLGVVWVGSDDNAPLPLTGATGALPVWRALFKQLPSESINRVQPPEVTFVWVDAASGMLSGSECQGALLLPFVKGTQPHQRANCERMKRRESWWRRLWDENN
ncbi:penicillin-binding protein 1B [Halioxenophilus aromaticivorans]|uniref:Penicillin-binding protein 1B n=1 Tax=Halioxenophilus aromaticivorans TaxID=1306992 RepID=A0AAV3UAJ8_9ALTE